MSALRKPVKKKSSTIHLDMKQRPRLASALLVFPSCLILDEPTNGLDPAGIQEMRELICTLPASTASQWWSPPTCLRESIRWLTM